MPRSLRLNAGPAADAEIIALAVRLLTGAGLRDVDVRLHSLGCAECRTRFRAALSGFFSRDNAGVFDSLCADCRRRIDRNPLRVMDCKTDGHLMDRAPHMEEFLCAECSGHFGETQALLRSAGIPYTVDHRLVRGLDYYTRTVFEVRCNALGSQDAVAAGGRYDSLVHELSGPNTPAVGFALGSERLLMALEGQGNPLPVPQKTVVLVAAGSSALGEKAFACAERLRLHAAAHRSPERLTVIEGPYLDRSLKSQFRLADRLGARMVVLFGEEEQRRGLVALRDMAAKTQEEVPEDAIVQRVLPG
jgi:histidyl-tRNA synthetase